MKPHAHTIVWLRRNDTKAYYRQGACSHPMPADMLEERIKGSLTLPSSIKPYAQTVPTGHLPQRLVSLVLVTGPGRLTINVLLPASFHMISSCAWLQALPVSVISTLNFPLPFGAPPGTALLLPTSVYPN